MPLVTSNGIDIPFTSSADQLVAESKRVIAELDKISARTKERRKLMEDAARAEAAALAKNKTSWTELNSAVMLGKQAIEAVKKAYNFAREGAQIEFLESKFSNLSASIGTTSAALMGDLRDATRGTLSDMELMASVTDLVGLGLANSHDEAVRLAKVSAGLGMNMNQLVLTLTNMTTMRFDALGVRVDGFKEKVKALEEAGYSADAAFKEAFLQQAEAQLLTVGNAADSSAGTFMKFEAATKNLTDGLKEMAADALLPTVERLAVLASEAENAKFTVDELNEAADEGRVIIAGNAETARKMRDAYYQNKVAVYEAKSSVDDFNAAIEETPPALIDAEQAAKDYADQLKVITDENKEFVGTLEKASDNLHKYKDGVAAADAALEAGEITAEEHGAKVAELAGQYEEASKRIVASLLEMKYMADGTFTDEELVSYMLGLEKLGLVTEEDRQATIALYQEATNLHTTLGAAKGPYTEYNTMLDRVTGRSEDARQEFFDMKESQAETAAGMRSDIIPAARGVAIALAGIKDEQVYVDIYFREHGGSIRMYSGHTYGGTTYTTEQLSDPGHAIGLHAGGGGQWAGGPLHQDLSIVGDAPGGAWTPYTEVIVGGKYVLDAKTARGLKDAGLLDGAMAYATGGSIGSRSPITGSGRAGSGTVGGRSPSSPSTRLPRSGDIDAAGVTDVINEAAAFAGSSVSAQVEAVLNSYAVSAASAQANSARNNELMAQLLDKMDALIARVATNAGVAKGVFESASKFS